ncbi:CBS domain-containing protein [Qipengyuania sp. MTN3-11]|uniref:CBS domain-containing protein n=1 Tax=Qipengyuania sp. MTN3-11 TaxID=3056557 RepID=UPI0036F2FD42
MNGLIGSKATSASLSFQLLGQETKLAGGCCKIRFLQPGLDLPTMAGTRFVELAESTGRSHSAAFVSQKWLSIERNLEPLERKMKISEIMTSDPACCKEDQSLQEAAKLMVDNDCGEIPVIGDDGSLVGVITDRDVCCRAVAEGMPAETQVGDVMTRSVVSVTPDTSLEDCLASMENSQVRRVPVIDDDGKCCGMVSQADIARTGSDAKTAELVQEVSQSRAEGKSSGCC